MVHKEVDIFFCIFSIVKIEMLYLIVMVFGILNLLHNDSVITVITVMYICIFKTRIMICHESFHCHGDLQNCKDFLCFRTVLLFSQSASNKSVQNVYCSV